MPSEDLPSCTTGDVTRFGSGGEGSSVGEVDSRVIGEFPLTPRSSVLYKSPLFSKFLFFIAIFSFILCLRFPEGPGGGPGPHQVRAAKAETERRDDGGELHGSKVGRGRLTSRRRRVQTRPGS